MEALLPIEGSALVCFVGLHVLHLRQTLSHLFMYHPSDLFCVALFFLR